MEKCFFLCCHNCVTMCLITKRKAVLDKVHRIIKTESGTPSFDRNILEAEYRLTGSLSIQIIGQNQIFARHLSRSAIGATANNYLMAFSALLLFVSNWEKEKASLLFNKISQIESVQNEE